MFSEASINVQNALFMKKRAHSMKISQNLKVKLQYNKVFLSFFQWVAQGKTTKNTLSQYGT